MIEIIPNWHPIWVHFTIGLLIIGTLFYALAFAGATRSWAHHALNAARWNLFAGILFAVVALVSGWLAANSVAHDDVGHANLLVHINWALIAAAIFIVAVVWLWIQSRKAEKKTSLPVLLLLLAGSAALGVTGFKGGANVYEHGLGVQRLPDIGAHDHAAHDHAHPGEAKEQDGHEGMNHQAMPAEEEPAATPDEQSSGHPHTGSENEHHH